MILSFRIDEFKLCLSLSEFGRYPTSAPHVIIVLQNILQIFVHTDSVYEEVLDTSQKAMAFDRIWPPLIIQSGLQQYSWCSLLYSSYSSFCNSVCFWALRCNFGLSRQPWKFSQTLLRLLRVLVLTRIRLYPLSGEILYHDSVPVIVLEFTSFIEDFVICCYQVTKLFCSWKRSLIASSARNPRNFGS